LTSSSDKDNNNNNIGTTKRKSAIKTKTKGTTTKKRKLKSSSITTKETTTSTKRKTKKMAPTKKGSKKKAVKKDPTKKKKDEPPAIPHAPESLVNTEEFEITRSRLLTLDTPLPRTKESLRNDDDDDDNDNDDGGNRRPCVVYWMIREARTEDNWALLFAKNLAVRMDVPLRVVYVLPPPPTDDDGDDDVGDDDDDDDGAAPPRPADMSLTSRHGSFLLDGLKVVASELELSNVPFHILRPSDRSSVGQSIHAHCCRRTSSSSSSSSSSSTSASTSTSASYRNNASDALAVVCDMSPLRYARDWTEGQAAPLLSASNVPLYQVDAHNIVPVWMASPKREVGARTLRPKINKLFGEYCTHFPQFDGNAHLEEEMSGLSGSSGEKENDGGHDWDRYREYLELDESIGSVNGMTAGHDAAMERFRKFCSSKQYGL